MSHHASQEMMATVPPQPVAALPSVTYGRGAQIFHWISFALLIGLVASGLYASWIGDGPLRSYLLESWHKPFGLLVIVLTALRLAWKSGRATVAEAEGLKRWESAMSRLTHWALYAVLLAMPLSGLLMSQGGGRLTSFFGLFDLPQLLTIDPSLGPREQYWYKVGKSLHENWVEWSLYTLFALHVAGALKHRFVDGDHTYLRRMWNWRG